MAIRPVLRLLFTVLALLACGLPALAQAATRTVMGTEYGITGVRIAISSSARLANLDDPALPMTRRPVYLHAGTRLLVLQHEDRERRTGYDWALAITEDGLLVYVNIDKNEHYFPHARLERRLAAGGRVAFVTSNVVAQSEVYGAVTLGRSEIYDFEYGEGDDIRVTVGRSKMGKDAYTVDDTVAADIGHFAIVSAEDLDPASIPDPFEPYGAERQLADFLASIADLEITKEERESLVAYFRQRFVTRKTCEQEIDLSKTVSASGELDFDALFSPVSAKLGISGSYSSQTVFPKGVDFTITRYIRNGNIVEIESRTIDEECSAEKLRKRILATDSNGSTGRLRTAAVREIGLTTTTEGLPVYTCNTEFEALRDMLTLEQTLDLPLATFVIARFATFRGADRPARCQASPRV